MTQMKKKTQTNLKKKSPRNQWKTKTEDQSELTRKVMNQSLKKSLGNPPTTEDHPAELQIEILAATRQSRLLNVQQIEEA